MISATFIDRPKMAFVVSIVITLAGVIAVGALPVEMYPEISPPTVQVSARFPGADAETVAETVAGPIESEVNGVEDMIYMSSNSSNDGSYSLTVTFDVGTDDDIATVNVQNRVAQATPFLPEEVRRQGVTTRKRSTNMLMVVNLYSPRETYDGLYLSNYASINIRDSISRLPGVGAADIIGALDYGMRIWLNPDTLAGLGMTAAEVIAAIREQNVQVPAGQVGQAPATPDTQFQYSLRTRGRLSDPEEFADIIIRTDPDGSTVRVRDVARVELGSQFYSAFGLLNGQDSVILAVYQLPGANALGVAEGVKDEMQRLSERFPDDIAYTVLYDNTQVIAASIREVIVTLVIAVLLVIAVVFVFIQDWRSTLIPAIAIPVSLVGTFAGLLAFGFSINLVTLFALILAIGIVVDDAIIVVENTQRHLAEGLSPREATRVAMSEIQGAIISTTLVLLAVFVPVGFMPGLTGRLYSQFSVAISVAVVISSINALTLSPALCASILRPVQGLPDTGFFGWFNRHFDRLRGRYVGWVGVLIRKSVVAMAAFAVFVGATAFLFTHMPSGFVPLEDRGAFLVDVQLPEGASLNRTERVVRDLQDRLLQLPGVTDVISAPGYSVLKQGVASNGAIAFVILEDWSQRRQPELAEARIVQRVQGMLTALPSANGFAFQNPPIPGLGSTGGFEFIMQSTANAPATDMAAVMRGLVVAANQHPDLGPTFSTFRATVPQYEVVVDRERAKIMGVPLGNLFGTLSNQLGSAYVNDFNLFGKTYRVLAQADTPYRQGVSDIVTLHTANDRGEMVPLESLVTVKPLLGPDIVSRYNIFKSITINGQPAPGGSSGEAIAAMEEVAARTLPEGYAFEWTGQTYQEILAGNLALVIFALALVFVYLFLVAQYESWTIPLAVLFAVPLAIFGAVVAQTLAGLPNDLYMQMGAVLLIGLAGKNAILIVEFAKQLREEQGEDLFRAATHAANLRFRAVLMTAFSFIIGVAPLVVAIGAGAASRRSLGTAVFGGMIAVAILGTLLVPVFFHVIQALRERVKQRGGASAAADHRSVRSDPADA